MQNDVASSVANDGYGLAAKSRELPDFTSLVFRPKPSESLSLMDTRYIVMQHQDLVNRNALCITRLREAAKEVENLRLENAALRSFNRELNHRLHFLIQASHKHYPPPPSIPSLDYDNTTPFQILNDNFRSFCNISGQSEQHQQEEEVCEEEEEEEEENPTSVIEDQNVDTTSSSTERISLPKSISVRSNVYLKNEQPTSSKNRNPTRSKPPTQLDAAQKVYVRGGKKEEEPLELEVFNQGMFKTELCNKWQETGACPYSDNCQFAHGIEELRPVIRHPRYKTEVCRMVLAGDVCPYGHRCHFRHFLTDQERFMGRFKNRSIKLHR